MPASQSLKLNTGAVMPTVGLGTWKSKPGEVEHAVEQALRHGYRHIDTAAAYGNEKEVGQGIKASGVPREDIFLCTKLNNPDHRHPEKALLASLEALDTPYIDLWLMHWPAPAKPDMSPDFAHDWLTTYKDMEAVYAKHPAKVKAIGVSNFSVEYLTRLLASASVVPAVNQVELHPSCPQHDVVAFCTQHAIALTAYSPLGSDNSPLLQNPVVGRIAAKHGVTAANVLVSLQANRPNVSVLPKSVTASRIQSNFTIIDLSQEEIDELHEIDKSQHFRACTPFWTGWDHLGFPDLK